MMPAAMRLPETSSFKRRAVTTLLAATLLAPGRVFAAAGPARGLVLPRLPAPDYALTDTTGRPLTLSASLRGHVTAVQLMFAGCSSTCPIQGAIFAAVAPRVGSKVIKLLSLTVDPLGDSPQALAAWLGKFGGLSHWSAAAPRVQDVAKLIEFLRGQAPNTGTHPTQVFLFDREARLAFRTVDLPAPQHVAGLLQQLSTA